MTFHTHCLIQSTQYPCLTGINDEETEVSGHNYTNNRGGRGHVVEGESKLATLTSDHTGIFPYAALPVAFKVPHC